jgi:hypothetical protein
VLGEQLRRRAEGDDAAVRHDRDGVGEPLGLLDIVRRHEHRRPLRPQPVDQRPQLLADLRVQPDVGSSSRRAAGGGRAPARSAGAAHAARQLVDPGVRALASSARANAASTAAGPIARRHAVEVREDVEVLPRRELLVEVVALRARRPSARGSASPRGARAARTR